MGRPPGNAKQAVAPFVRSHVSSRKVHGLDAVLLQRKATERKVRRRRVTKTRRSMGGWPGSRARRIPVWMPHRHGSWLAGRVLAISGGKLREPPHLWGHTPYQRVFLKGQTNLRLRLNRELCLRQQFPFHLGVQRSEARLPAKLVECYAKNSRPSEPRFRRPEGRTPTIAIACLRHMVGLSPTTPSQTIKRISLP
jgi:hypothetical protein